MNTDLIAGAPPDPSKTWKIQFVNPKGEIIQRGVVFNLGVIEELKAIHGVDAEDEVISSTAEAVKLMLSMIVKGSDKALENWRSPNKL